MLSRASRNFPANLSRRGPCPLPHTRDASVRGVVMIPVKKQITQTSIWRQNLDVDPKTVDPKRFMPEKTLERISVPFTESANGPLRPTPYEKEVPDALPLPRGLLKTVVSMRRTVKVTKGGKVMSMSAMVVVGDGNGAAGFGEGKDMEPARAVKKATMRAHANMVAINRYDDRTILHDLEHKFKATLLQMRAAPPGFGIRTNPNVHEICRCAGIHDLSAKVMGSRNPINVVKATFQALSKQKTPDELACARGLRVHDVRKLVYGR